MALHGIRGRGSLDSRGDVASGHGDLLMELLDDLRQGIRSDLQTELASIKAEHMQMMAKNHKTVTEQIAEAERRLQASLAQVELTRPDAAPCSPSQRARLPEQCFEHPRRGASNKRLSSSSAPAYSGPAQQPCSPSQLDQLPEECFDEKHKSVSGNKRFSSSSAPAFCSSAQRVSSTGPSPGSRAHRQQRGTPTSRANTARSNVTGPSMSPLCSPMSSPSELQGNRTYLDPESGGGHSVTERAMTDRVLTRSLTHHSHASPAGSLEWRRHMTRRVRTNLDRGARLTEISVESMRSAMQSLSLTNVRGQAQAAIPHARPLHYLEKLVDSACFEVISCILVVANAVTIGVQLDMCMKDALSEKPIGCDNILPIIDEVFAIALIVEVGLRVLGKRLAYLTDPMWKWNIFDVVLAALGIADLVLLSLNIPYARLLRFFRLVRLLRVVRTLRWLRDLRQMASTLLQSVVSLASAFALLFVVMFVFGVFFLQGVAAHLEEHDRSQLGDEQHSNLAEFYGSIPRVMYTLLLATTNGVDWKELADPLGHISPVYQALFGMYVAIVLIGALNVLTSVFVERARELSMLDRDLATQTELAAQEAFILEMRRVFEEVDNGKDGMISWEQFRDYLKNDSAQAFFTTQQLDTSDAAGLFSLLDRDGEGKIKIEDFALGCMRLRGQAKSSEVAKIEKQITKVMKELRALRKSQLEDVQGDIAHSRRPPSARGKTPSASAKSSRPDRLGSDSC